MHRQTDPAVIAGYLEDSSNLTGGRADGVYLPESASEVREALTACVAKKTPLTVSAGQTGTTGSCIPFGGWLLTTRKLNKIINIDKSQKFAVVEPGVTLEELEKAAAKEGLLYPPDPTEKSATLGGNVATNASGGRCYRFGATRDWVKRLKIALPNGSTLDLQRGAENRNTKIEILKKLEILKYETPKIKCSAGYFHRSGMDPLDLFIGSEGTLGIVTEIEVGLVPALQETFDLVAFFPTEEQAVNFVEESKRQEDRAVNFYEFFDANTLEMLRPSYPLIPTPSKAAVYVEQEIVDAGDKAYMDYWAELLQRHGASLETCWLGADRRQKEELTKFRSSIPEHINEIFKQHRQIKLATDIAVPEGKFKEMFAFYNAELGTRNAELFHIKFGHIGDNHLHVNLVAKKPEHFDLAGSLVLKFIRKAVALGGTVSAEHGIGKIKHDYLREMYGASGIKEMVRIKKELDPGLILGRGNIFPAGRP